MGARVTVDLSRALAGLVELEGGAVTGEAVASEAQRLMDRYMRKDTTELAASATPGPWHVRYPMPYARRVWFPGTRIVSPRNSRATYQPDAQPGVRQGVARAMARRAREVFGG